MGFCINTLLDKIIAELNIFNPKWCRKLDDPRIDTYYISINQNNYIVLSGYCGGCDNIYIYNNDNIKYDIMTTHGINNYVNTYGEQIDMGNIIFELKLDTFNGNMKDLLLFLTNSVKEIIPL